jgi:hypothetical protein
MKRFYALFALTLLGGCMQEEEVMPTRPLMRVEFSTVDPGPSCRPVGAVEVRAGERDPTTHEILNAYALERGGNYVVLDSFGVIDGLEDIYAVTRARVLACPVSLVAYGCRPQPRPVCCRQ